MQHAVVMAELAVATMLVVGAGLLTRTMTELQRVDPGYDLAGLVELELDLPVSRLRDEAGSWDGVGALYDPMAARLRAELASVPGVRSLALTSMLPFGGGRSTTSVEPEGYEPADGEVLDAAFRFVTPEYFDVLHIAALQGRTFRPADGHPDAERLVIVTERFARRFWPDRRWIDRSVTYWGTPHRVVGVIPDVREQDLRGDIDGLKFYVAARGYWGAGNVGSRFLLRVDRPVHAIAPELRARVRDVDEGIAIVRLGPLRDRILGSVAEYRYRMRLMTAFAVIAAAFALLGIYGVMSRSVVRRRREIGVRVALGAPRHGIARDVVADGVRIGSVGIALGMVGALAGSRVLESLLWGVPRTDAPTYVVIAIALLALTGAASLIPARRAAAVEPTVALKG